MKNQIDVIVVYMKYNPYLYTIKEQGAGIHKILGE
jgi:hypothetical protein